MSFYILQVFIFNKTIKYSFKKFLRDIFHNKKYSYSLAPAFSASHGSVLFLNKRKDWKCYMQHFQSHGS